MKKLLLLTILIVMGLTSAKAQFVPQLSGHFESGIGEQNGNGLGYNFVAGWNLGNFWRLGAGTGIETMLIWDDEVATIIPLFFDAKLYLSRTKIRPFLNARIGVDFLCTDMEYYQYEKTNSSGAISTGAGIDIPLKRGKIFIQCDYKFRDYDSYESVEGVRFSVGYFWDKSRRTNTEKTGSIIY